MPVEIKIDRLNEVLEKIALFSKVELLVGIPGNKTIRKNKEKKENEMITTTNAELGFINEFGSPAKNIPARSFLRPGIKKIKPVIGKILKKYTENFLHDQDIVRKGLERVGIEAVSSVKNIIRMQENFKPLSKRTIELRKEKGFDGEKALIRTGQLLNSITHVLREK
jgi:hypothetical protein